MLPDSCAPRRCRRGLTALLLATLLATAAGAADVESLYTAEVPLDPADPAARDAAYARALDQVLIRITGSEAAAFSRDIDELIPNPARYVVRYRPAEDNRLAVTFDGAALEQLLRGSGVPVWGSDRPRTLLVLAVDWGQGDRELVGAGGDADIAAVDLRAARRNDLKKRLRRVALQRGVPVAFADLQRPALAALEFVDVWGGFHERLLRAAHADEIDSILVGRLRPDLPERNRWSYYYGSRQQQWNGDPEEAMHLLADTLAGEYALAGNAPVRSVLLTIANVASVHDYVAVQKLIGEMQIIDSYHVAAVDGDSIRYAVRINGGAGRLAAALDFNRDLERRFADAADGPPPGGDSLSYAFRP